MTLQLILLADRFPRLEGSLAPEACRPEQTLRIIVATAGRIVWRSRSADNAQLQVDAFLRETIGKVLRVGRIGTAHTRTGRRFAPGRSLTARSAGFGYDRSAEGLSGCELMLYFRCVYFGKCNKRKKWDLEVLGGLVSEVSSITRGSRSCVVQQF